MAISRPLLLALIGAALLAATVFAVQNARNGASDSAAPAAQQPAEQAAEAAAPAPEPARAEALSPQEALAAVLEPGTPVDSGRFSFEFETQEKAGGREHDTVKVSGAFDDADKGPGVSNFDVRYSTRDEVTASKLESATRGRVLAVDGEGYLGAGDKLYRVPAESMKGLDTIRSAMAGGVPAKLPEFQLTRWISQPKVVGTEQLDGVDTTHVTAEVAAASVAGDILKLVKAEASGAGAEARLPGNTRSLAKQSVKEARFDAWVGSDRILRRARLAVTFDAPKAMREPGDSARWTADAELRLTDVNKAQTIEAPAGAESGRIASAAREDTAQDAESTFTLLALGLDAPGGVVGTTYSFLTLNRFTASSEVARKVLASVKAGKETVVFFRNPNALDDDATAESVAYLESSTKKLAVFTDDVANTERYGRLVENLGVTQAPAIVFIDRRGTASLIEGYVDGPSLAQVVADAR